MPATSKQDADIRPSRFFLNICQLFCVSSDWLLGLSPSPYNTEFILAAETALISKRLIINGAAVSVFNQAALPTAYYDARQRCTTYLPAVRANIVFLMYLETAFLAYGYYHANPSSIHDVAEQTPFFHIMANQKVYAKKLKKRELYTNALLKLLQNPTTPLYPIT